MQSIFKVNRAVHTNYGQQRWKMKVKVKRQHLEKGVERKGLMGLKMSWCW